jgi:hypothetical protein
MKEAVEMDLDVIARSHARTHASTHTLTHTHTHTHSYIKIGSGLQKLIGRDSQKHRQHGDLISLLFVFKNKESRL